MYHALLIVMSHWIDVTRTTPALISSSSRYLESNDPSVHSLYLLETKTDGVVTLFAFSGYSTQSWKTLRLLENHKWSKILHKKWFNFIMFTTIGLPVGFAVSSSEKTSCIVVCRQHMRCACAITLNVLGTIIIFNEHSDMFEMCTFTAYALHPYCTGQL